MLGGRSIFSTIPDAVPVKTLRVKFKLLDKVRSDSQ